MNRVESINRGMGRAARDMILELVDIVRETAPGFVTAKLVRKVDVYWALHGLIDEMSCVAIQRQSESHEPRPARRPSAQEPVLRCHAAARREGVHRLQPHVGQHRVEIGPQYPRVG